MITINSCFPPAAESRTRRNETGFPGTSGIRSPDLDQGAGPGWPLVRRPLAGAESGGRSSWRWRADCDVGLADRVSGLGFCDPVRGRRPDRTRSDISGHYAWPAAIDTAAD